MPRKVSNIEYETAAILDAAGIAYEREYVFHPTRKWRFDFAIPARKIAIECEGLVYRGVGHHQSIKGILRDCEKYNAAAALGWRVFRCTNKGEGATTPSAVIAAVKRLL